MRHTRVCTRVGELLVQSSCSLPPRELENTFCVPGAQTAYLEGLLFLGTLPPCLRALERPMAIACLGLVTFFPDLPLLSFPCLYSCIDFLTSCFDFVPYFAMMRALRS